LHCGILLFEVMFPRSYPIGAIHFWKIIVMYS
jgi:hypothetical protein